MSRWPGHPSCWLRTQAGDAADCAINSKRIMTASARVEIHGYCDPELAGES